MKSNSHLSPSTTVDIAGRAEYPQCNQVVADYAKGAEVAIAGASVYVNTKTILELVNSVHQGEFVIPDFQRDVVWRRSQVAALWDSVYRGFPIGSLLYWTTGEQLAALRSIGGFYLPNNHAALNHFGSLHYVLDGQQRLTAFFVAMTGGTKVIKSDLTVNYALYFDAAASIVPTALILPAAKGERGVSPAAERYFFFEGERQRRVVELNKAGVSPKLLVRLDTAAAVSAQVRQLLATEKGYTPEMGQSLARMEKALLEYRVPIVSVSDASADDVSQIFQRVNKSGTELTIFDIAVARAYRAGNRGEAAFSLGTQVDNLKQELKKRSFAWGNIKNLDLLRMIAYCLRTLQDCGDLASPTRISAEQADLASIGDLDLTRVWDRVEGAIVRAIKFFISQGLHKPDMLAAEYLPLPICAHLLDHHYTESAPEWTQISRWFWRHAFDRLSIKDQSAADQALRTVFATLGPDTALQLSPLRLSANDLITARTSNSARFVATWGFLSYLGPRDVVTGQFVTIDPKSRWTRLTGSLSPSLHHIYPKAFLARMPGRLNAQSIMNVAIISKQSNMEIGDTSPVDYFPKLQQQLAALQPRQDIEAVMASHLIPTSYFKRPKVTADDYTAFLIARATLVIERLRAEFSLTIVNGAAPS